MTVVLRAVFIVALVLAGALNCAPQDKKALPRAAPKAVVPFTSYQFDSVYRGEVISQFFIIKNTGNADLVITGFTAGSGREIVGSDRVIAPGKEGTAHIEVDTANAIGYSVLAATLHTNDIERKDITFSLVANVLANPDGSPLRGVRLRQGKHVGPIFVAPYDRYSFNVAPREKAHTEFIISVDKRPVRVLRVEDFGPNFKARIVTIEEGKSYKLVVEIIPSDQPSRAVAVLRVVTDSPLLPYFQVYISSTPKR